MCSTCGADGAVILYAVILHPVSCILRARGVLLCSAHADLQDLCLMSKYGSRQKFPTGGHTGAWMQYVRSVCSARDRCMRASSSESVWIEPADGCAADGCKTTIIFSTSTDCSNIQYATKKNAKTFERDFEKLRSKFRLSNWQRLLVQVGFQ